MPTPPTPPAGDQPAPSSEPAAGSFAASIRKTLALARQRVASRPTARPPAEVAAPVAETPIPETTPIPEPPRAAERPAPPDRRRTIKCRTCAKSRALTPDEMRQLARGTWPMCCARIMLPVAQPDLGDVVSSTPADRRSTVRRAARAGSRVEVRRGLSGTNPNLALKLVDVSEEGGQVLLKEPIRAFEVVEVALGTAAGALAARGPAVICWCVPTPSGQFRAGVQFRHRLDAESVALLAQE